MPEYLAPGVFVEELDVGIRPIEGVSTSTGGMVGVTERGPQGVPVLVTSFAEFSRIFGGYLRFSVYGDAAFLPHAVEGFFQNGGRRLYVTRVAADANTNSATHAEVMLYDRGEGSGFEDTRLLKHARPGDGLVLAETTAGLANEDSLRVGEGSTVEYPALAAANALVSAGSRVLALRTPLYGAHSAGDAVQEVTLAAPADAYSGTLEGDHAAGAATLLLDPAAADFDHVAVGQLLLIGAGANREVAVVASVSSPPAGPRVGLETPLGRDHADGEVVELREPTPAGGSTVLAGAAEAGDGLLLVDATAGFAANEVVEVQGGAGTEYHLLAALSPWRLEHPAAADHSAGTGAAVVTFADTPNPDDHATTLAADASAGDREILVADAGTLAVGEHLRFGPNDPTAEYALISEVDGDHVTLLYPLTEDRPSGHAVTRVSRTVVTATHLAQDLGDGETTLFLGDSGASFVAGALLEIGAPGSNAAEYRRLEAASLGVLVLGGALGSSHLRGSVVGRRDPQIRVRALDSGPWGNDLVVTASGDSLLSTTAAADTLPGLPVPLTSVVGVEVGTVLEVGASGSGRLAKVVSLTGNQVSLAYDGAPFGVSQGEAIRSREMRLSVSWKDASGARSRGSEELRYLSLDPRHSRYVETIVGAVDGPERGWDRRPEGQSDFIRVDDQASAAAAESSIRLGPDQLTAVGFGGRITVAGRSLTGGNNPPAGITASTFIGVDHVDPNQRTGLATLRNENRISMVAVPGQTDPDVQQALIDHCELERYRFAVLDSLPGTDRVRGAAISEVQDQRNLYDTRYAALYYPWLVARDPFASAAVAGSGDLYLPPSGHMMGIYARTDVERGVHKAPANEVIRGIRALQRKLNQAEQEVLNPSPTNVNVLRDFREQGRGLRVWGARCITSETDWKYVNVRRLFLFLEQSLDEGTQWVVFEPNDAPLWARVRQTITAFLTRVWRDGALQGASPEEAFFVKCDRSTMTQDDIDNGRLIVMVGVAPVKPAEFVIIRIFQSTVEASDA